MLHYSSHKVLPTHHQKPISMNSLDKSLKFPQLERSYNQYGEVTPVHSKREGFASFSQANNPFEMNNKKPGFNLNIKPFTERAHNAYAAGKGGSTVIKEITMTMTPTHHQYQSYQDYRTPQNQVAFGVNYEIQKKPAPAGFNLNYGSYKNFSLNQPLNIKKKIEEGTSLELDLSEIPHKRGLSLGNPNKKKSTKRLNKDRVFSEILSELNRPLPEAEPITKVAPVLEKSTAQNNLQIGRQKEIADELMKLEQEYTNQRKRLEIEREEVRTKERDNEIFRKNIERLWEKVELPTYPVGSTYDIQEEEESEILESFIKAPRTMTMTHLDVNSQNGGYLEHKRHASSLTNVSNNTSIMESVSGNTSFAKNSSRVNLRKSKNMEEYMKKRGNLPSITDHPSLEDSILQNSRMMYKKPVIEQEDSGIHLFDYEETPAKFKSDLVRSSKRFTTLTGSTSSLVKAGTIISSKNEL